MVSCGWNLTVEPIRMIDEKLATPLSTSPQMKSSERLTLTANFDLKPEDVFVDDNKVLGKGAYGVVKKGRWRHTDVAIKQLLLTMPTEAAHKEFKAEMVIMSKLRSPNIVQLYGVCFKHNSDFKNFGDCPNSL